MSNVDDDQVEPLDANNTRPELERLAERKATEILEKIKKQSENIEDAKKLATKAKNHQRPWYKRFSAGSKTDNLADAIIGTNTAVSGLSELIQESIRYTCTSIEFAQTMHKTMAHMMVHGFKDSNGELQKMGESSKEFVDDILTAADDFVRKQRIVEEKQARLREKLDAQSEASVQQSLRLDEVERSLENVQDFLDAQEASVRSVINYIKNQEKLDEGKNALIEQLSNQVKYLRPALFLSVVSLITSVGTLGFFLFN